MPDHLLPYRAEGAHRREHHSAGEGAGNNAHAINRPTDERERDVGYSYYSGFHILPSLKTAFAKQPDADKRGQVLQQDNQFQVPTPDTNGN
ncbi:hypothetical protein CB1_000568043 [Camelus ferus]|nr:hypothetical protein CB1_000568043 [Camelus ferus]